MSAHFDQLKSMYDRFTAAWKTNDGAALAGHFLQEGTLINPFGERAEGRAAVAAMYSQYFKSILAGTSTTIELLSVRALGADHAFADSKQIITGPDGSAVLVCHLAALMRRENDSWRFVDARPYSFATRPA